MGFTTKKPLKSLGNLCTNPSMASCRSTRAGTRPARVPHNDLRHCAAGHPCPAREGLHLCRPSLEVPRHRQVPLFPRDDQSSGKWHQSETRISIGSVRAVYSVIPSIARVSPRVAFESSGDCVCPGQSIKRIVGLACAMPPDNIRPRSIIAETGDAVNV